MSSVTHSGTKLATRLAFLVSGFVMGCWAPLAPFAKSRIGAGNDQFGLILLCLGFGSLLAMPLAGWLSARAGSKPIIVCSGLALSFFLPLLLVADAFLSLASALFCLGAALGSIDVGMNIHAVAVERASSRPLMSGFHGMYSLGGILGAGGMTFLLSAGLSPLAAALVCAVLAAAAVAVAWPRLLPARGRSMPVAAPHGIVLLLSGLCAVVFLVEGAILDWGALLSAEAGLVASERGGLGYMLFSIAMTSGRFSGDRVVARVGNCRTLTWGGLIVMAGFSVLLSAAWPPAAMSGFLLIGMGASNIVPVLFRLTARQTVMPVDLAVAAMTTTGYAGILLGPAAIGFVSSHVGLHNAFWLLAVLIGLVPLLARRIAK